MNMNGFTIWLTGPSGAGKTTLAKHPIKSYQLTKTTQKIVAIGASTGGTVALEILLKNLPKNFPGIC
jgi:two-component system chemotaxis response regulator CheB